MTRRPMSQDVVGDTPPHQLPLCDHLQQVFRVSSPQRGADPIRVRQLVGGQALIAYAVLIAAVALGVSVAAGLTYRAFVGHAEEIETQEVSF